jgi:hypothetical protein
VAGPADLVVAAVIAVAVFVLWLAGRVSLRRDDRLRRLEVAPRPTKDPRQHFTVLRFYDQDAEP